MILSEYKIVPRRCCSSVDRFGVNSTILSRRAPSIHEVDCFGLVCVAATSYFWGWWLGRMNVDDV